MISCRGIHGEPVSRGLEREVRAVGGATVSRIIEGANSTVAEHVHDWPIISIYVMGECSRALPDGEVRMASPLVVFQPAGAAHANAIGRQGFEQLDIEFDPAWLSDVQRDRLREVRSWKGGRTAIAARSLSRLWLDQTSDEQELVAGTAQFLKVAFESEPAREPVWLAKVVAGLSDTSPQSIDQLARHAGIRPAWLGQAYNAAMGEGLRQTMLRKRVECAVILLRETSLPAADIAVAAGFYDQSHMIRCFQALLARTPSVVRAEASSLSAHAAPEAAPQP